MGLLDYGVNTGKQILHFEYLKNIFCGYALESYYLATFLFHRYDLKEFVDNGKIVTTLDNGEKVESRPSVLKPNCKLWSILVMKYMNDPIQTICCT